MIDDNEIKLAAVSVMSAMRDVEGGRTTYLRTLLTAVQEVIGKRGKDAKEQLAALTATHKRFYAVVLKVAEDFVPEGTKKRAIALHAKATFARTSTSALRMHIKAGGDVMTLKAENATKRALRAKAPAPAVNPVRLKATAERLGKRVMTMLEALGKADKAAAVIELQVLSGAITAQLLKLGAAADAKDVPIARMPRRPPVRVGADGHAAH